MPWSLACVRLFRILAVADLLLLSGVSAADAEARVPRRHGARIIAEESAGERLVDLTVSSPGLGVRPGSGCCSRTAGSDGGPVRRGLSCISFTEASSRRCTRHGSVSPTSRNCLSSVITPG